MDSRTYVIINTAELRLIDFSQILSTSEQTTVSNIEGDKSIVKYTGEMPETIHNLKTKTLHNHSEIIEIVNSDEWKGKPEDEDI